MVTFSWVNSYQGKQSNISSSFWMPTAAGHGLGASPLRSGQDCRHQGGLAALGQLPGEAGGGWCARVLLSAEVCDGRCLCMAENLTVEQGYVGVCGLWFGSGPDSLPSTALWVFELHCTMYIKLYEMPVKEQSQIMWSKIKRHFLISGHCTWVTTLETSRWVAR